MQVVIDEKLKKHMQSNNYKDIVLYTEMCNTWSGAFLNLLARFANIGEEPAEKDFYKVESELGNVFLPKLGVLYGKEVRLGLRKLLWLKGITISGARPA